MCYLWHSDTKSTTSFKYCTTTDNRPVFSIKDACKSSNVETDGELVKDLFVLEKSQYHVDGFGYKSTKKEIKTTTFKSFWGEKWKGSETIIMKVSSDECLAMTISKL